MLYATFGHLRVGWLSRLAVKLRVVFVLCAKSTHAMMGQRGLMICKHALDPDKSVLVG